MQEGQLLFAEQGNLALLQVIGRGTYKLALGFKAWIDGLVSSSSIQAVWLDMSHCSSLDSTFMGLMVTMALQTKGRIPMLVVNATPEHHALLDGIGVTRVWKYIEQPVPTLNWTSLAEAAGGAVAMGQPIRDVIIEAHTRLMELDEDNVPKFKDVVELMKREQP